MHFTATITVLPHLNIGSMEVQGPLLEQWVIHRIEGPSSFSLSPRKGSREDQRMRCFEQQGAVFAHHFAKTHGGIVTEVNVVIDRG